MLTRSAPRPARRGLLGPGRAVRAGLALAAVGVVVVGTTGGTAFAFNRPSPDGGPATRTHGVHAADGGRQAGDRKAGKVPARPKAGSTPRSDAKPDVKADAKTGRTSKAKARAKSKAKTNARVAARNKVGTGSKPKTPHKAPAATPPTSDGMIASTTPPAATSPATGDPSANGSASGSASGSANGSAPGSAAGSPGTASSTDPDSTVAPMAPVSVGPPAPPKAVTVTMSGPSALTVSWSVDVSATGIVDHFEATAVEDRTRTCQTPTNAATSCTVKGLAAGTTYTFVVRAVGVLGAGVSKPSETSAPAALAADVTARSTTAVQPSVAAQPAQARSGVKIITPGFTRSDPAGPPARTAVDSKPRTKGTDRGTGSTADKGRDTAQPATAGQQRGTTGGFGGLLGLPDGTPAAPAAEAATGGAHRTRTGVLALMGLGGLLTAGLAVFGVTRARREGTL
ncbi:fibronectin type III domain-containing protein [Dactylosporangium sp. NPDC005555]|uniref:fibronectin type III domain-containing protein n=1 Tax=Dactylosporangium sp. NPDC005555 TaxID=3154889 RepID=UPI0033B495CC